MARISCRSQLILDTWRANLATNRRFSRPRPLRERMKRKSCHGSPPENAPRHSLATTGRPGMHYSYILPMKSPTAARKYSVLVSRHTASAPPSGTGSASADAPNHGAGASAADGYLTTGGAVGCGWAPGCGRDCRLRAGPPTAARSATSRLSTARTSTMPKTRMNPFTPTFPRYCTVIGFICYVTNN